MGDMVKTTDCSREHIVCLLMDLQTGARQWTAVVRVDALTMAPSVAVFVAIAVAHGNRAQDSESRKRLPAGGQTVGGNADGNAGGAMPLTAGDRLRAVGQGHF